MPNQTMENFEEINFRPIAIPPRWKALFRSVCPDKSFVSYTQMKWATRILRKF